MKKIKPLLPFADYQRIFQVLYTLLKTADGYTYKGCKYYAMAGAFLLHEHYKLDANPMAGAAAFQVSDAARQVLYFGRVENNALISDEEAFHAWIECEGFLIDFMAPMFPEALRDTGSTAKIGRRMFQKPLELDAPGADLLQREGDFCISANLQLTRKMRQDFMGEDLQSDLVKVAARYYRRPPKVLDRDFQIYDTKLKGPVRITLSAPTLTGTW